MKGGGATSGGTLTLDLIHSPSGHKRPFAYLQYMEQPPSVQIMKTISSEPGACQYLYPGFHPSLDPRPFWPREEGLGAQPEGSGVQTTFTPAIVVYLRSLGTKPVHEQLPIMLILTSRLTALERILAQLVIAVKVTDC